MEDNVSKIKERVDVVDLVSSYLKLQKAGVNFKAPCPFHNEKSGSFFVSPERQIWHCFGCGLGGDIFSFVQQIEGVEFPDALRILAARAGIELTRISPELRNAKSQLYEICELATKFFQKQLHGSAVGKQALVYLVDRGVSETSIQSFRLGYAPDVWQGLFDFLNKHYTAQDIVDAGLAIRKDKGGSAQAGYYDRFRSRIMFPIADLNGQIVGFAGRVFVPVGVTPTDEAAKYINTPQTPIYDKSRILYGMDKAKLSIRQNNRCLMVEGNLDVVMSHQVGVTQAVASSGTAMTEGHLKIIRRYTDNVDLCFDADSAGSMATERAVTLALAAGCNVGIVAIDEPELKDPADYVKKHGQQWQTYTQQSKPFLDYYFRDAQKKYDIATALGKKQFARKILPFVASIANTIEREHWISETALLLKMQEPIIRQEVTDLKSQTRSSQPMQSPSSVPVVVSLPPEQHLDILEESIFSIVAKQPQLLTLIIPEYEVLLTDYGQEVLAQLRTLPQALAESSQLVDKSVVKPLLTMSLEFVLLRAQEVWKDIADSTLEGELHKLLSQLKKRSITARLQSLEYEIRAAERTKDKSRLALLLGEFSQLSKELTA